MKFLIDECISFRFAKLLVEAGHDAVHVADCGIAGEPDTVVMETARTAGRVLISADTDFGELLARSGADAPSVVIFRREERRPEKLAAILLANLETISADLDQGALAVIAEKRMRIRTLPI